MADGRGEPGHLIFFGFKLLAFVIQVLAEPFYINLKLLHVALVLIGDFLVAEGSVHTELSHELILFMDKLTVIAIELLVVGFEIVVILAELQVVPLELLEVVVELQVLLVLEIQDVIFNLTQVLDKGPLGDFFDIRDEHFFLLFIHVQDLVDVALLFTFADVEGQVND